jgi:U3 small nucleolar RNA-associated protein 10
MRELYTRANSTGAFPLLTTAIIRTIFVTLATDSLAFLAGVWASSPAQTVGQRGVQNVALVHAAAFLAAHKDMRAPVDFQTILPCMLVALQSEERAAREAAMDCVAVLAQLAAAEQASVVYALDTVYGGDTGVSSVPASDSTTADESLISYAAVLGLGGFT